MPEISDLPELAEAPADDDLFVIVDVSAPAGSRTKNIRADRIGGTGGGVPESYVTVVNDGSVQGVELDRDSGADQHVQLGSIGYYEPEGFAGNVLDPNHVITIVGDDFQQNANYDDEHYGAFYLPPDVGGLFAFTVTYYIFDQATVLFATNPIVHSSCEVYSMPGFTTVAARPWASVPAGATSGQAAVTASIMEWWMPEPGESLYFGFWINNNHTSQDVYLNYYMTIAMLARKEA